MPRIIMYDLLFKQYRILTERLSEGIIIRSTTCTSALKPKSKFTADSITYIFIQRLHNVFRRRKSKRRIKMASKKKKKKEKEIKEGWTGGDISSWSGGKKKEKKITMTRKKKKRGGMGRRRSLRRNSWRSKPVANIWKEQRKCPLIFCAFCSISGQVGGGCVCVWWWWWGGGGLDRSAKPEFVVGYKSYSLKHMLWRIFSG